MFEQRMLLVRIAMDAVDLHLLVVVVVVVGLKIKNSFKFETQGYDPT
jgi:hypothetical protein